MLCYCITWAKTPAEFSRRCKTLETIAQLENQAEWQIQTSSHIWISHLFMQASIPKARQKTSAARCNFGNRTSSKIQIHIIQWCLPSKLTRRALKDSKITLATLLQSARTMEIAEQQAHAMETIHIKADKESLNALHKPQHTKATSNGWMTFHRTSRPETLISDDSDEQDSGTLT